MNIRKGTPPAAIERAVEIDLTREEVLSVLVAYVKGKQGQNFRFDNLMVAGDEGDKLRNVTLAGFEIVPLTWKDSTATPTPAVVTPPATPVTTSAAAQLPAPKK